MISKPIVDGLEADLTGHADVVRVDVLSGTGRDLAGLYGVQGTPMFLLMDTSGEMVDYHAGIPNRGEIRERILALLSVQ